MKVKVEKFWSGWKDEMKKLLEIVHELEKTAAKEGYLLAVGLSLWSMSDYAKNATWKKESASIPP